MITDPSTFDRKLRDAPRTAPSLALSVALGVLMLSPYAIAQQPKITTIDFPGSNETEPLSINRAGEITGLIP